MQDYHFQGVGSLTGGEFRTLTLEGVGSCSHDIKAENMHIQGVFNCSGNVEADYLSCEGVANFKSNIKAKKMFVEGVFNQKDDSKIEADEIICEGVITSRGEINADLIKAEGCISAKEIVGDKVIIDSYKRKWTLFNFNRKKGSSNINFIEATTIEISGVIADTVNGKDIKIGPQCKINNVDCSGTLYIDKDSIVKNITGEYTMSYK